jgi:iron(III) transport system permease protein
MIHKKLLVPILLFTILILLPIAALFLASFVGENGDISIAPLESLLLDSRQLGLMKNSLALAGGATFFSLLLGVPLAFLIKRTELPFRDFFNTAYLAPLLFPPYLQATVWMKFFSPDQGVISGPSIFSLAGGIFVYTLCFFPFVTLITSSGLESIDPSLEEVSLTGKTAFQTVRGITLPLITPHITSGAILVFVFTLVNFEVADILRLKVYPIEIFINFSAYYDEKAATLLSVPMISVSMLLIWSQMVLMRGKSYAHLGSSVRRRSTFSLGSWNTTCFAFVSLLILISIGLPLWVLVKGAGPLENYARVFSSCREQIFYSLWISALSSLIMVLFSWGISYYFERETGRLRSFLDFLIQIPFGVPSIVLGIGLIRVWNRSAFDWIYGTSAILVLGLTAGYAPFVVKIVSTKMKQVHREFEEAALFATSSRARIFGRILFPLSLPGLIAGFTAGFVLSLSNLGIALLVTSPGKATLPIKIFNFMHYGAEEIVFASNLILMAVIALALASLYTVLILIRRWNGL